MPLEGITQRILVKATQSVAGTRLNLGEGTLTFSSEPLFQSIGDSTVLGLFAPSQWHLLTPVWDPENANVSDSCHRLLTDGPEIAGAPRLEFTEPELDQRWLNGDVSGKALAAALGCAVAKPQDARFPLCDRPPCLRKDGYSQFSGAPAEFGHFEPGQSVRIVHLDAGFDPKRGSLPDGLNRDLQKNFVDANRPKGLTDNSSARLNNRDYGNGNLAIPAGTPVGACGQPYGSVPFYCDHPNPRSQQRGAVPKQCHPSSARLSALTVRQGGVLAGGPATNFSL
jgi:hypothetical protein